MSTGPPYPPPPAPGSNAIGLFQIGVSPFGTIIPFDWFGLTVISQYANSPILDAYLGGLDAALDQTYNFDQFFDHMFNVDTADGYGLDVWGRIVVAPRVIHVPTGGPYLGFEEADDPLNEQPFNVGIFYSGTGLTNNYSLPDSAYRLCILAKAATNIWDGSIPALNEILLNLFPGRGDCYCTDGGNMTMTYTFNFALTDVELTIVESAGILPKPSGVSVTVVVNP